MASYRLNREALEDLDRLYEHGVLTFGLRQADAFFDGIVNRFQKIADQPELYPAIDHIRQGYRRSVYKSHSIYYRIYPDLYCHYSNFWAARHRQSAISVLCSWESMAKFKLAR